MLTKLILQKRGVVRLTGNDKTVLKILLKNSRTSDVDIGNSLKISSQSISKIRRKLENIGIIKNYCIELNYSSLGINAFALVMLEIFPTISEEYEMTKLISENLISLYKVFKNDITHVALFGFRDLNELDEHFNSLSFRYSEYIKIRDIYIFPAGGLLKHSPTQLLYKTINELGKENMPVPPTLVYYLEKKKKNKIEKLSTNEKNVLSLLIKNSRISYTKLISELNDLSITNRAVSKIKKRLEDRGVINGYSVNLDYEKLGVNIFAFIFLNKKTGYWELKDGLCKLANKAYNVIGCYRLNEDSLHVLFCGFRNLDELENYCYYLQSKNKDLFEIKKVYVTSNKGILKDSPSDLFNMILKQKIKWR